MRSFLRHAVLAAVMSSATAGTALSQTMPVSDELRRQVDRVTASEQRANAGQPPAMVRPSSANRTSSSASSGRSTQPVRTPGGRRR